MKLAGEIQGRDTLPDDIAAFLASERLRGRRPVGVKGLRSTVRKFFRYLEESGLEVEQLGIAEAYGFQGWLREQRTKAGTPLTNSSIYSAVLAANAYCEYLRREGRLLENPFRLMRKVRREKRIPEGIPREAELEKLLDFLADFTAPTDLKSRARRYLTHVMAELSYASGLRLSELAALEPRDVDLTARKVIVREGKQGESRLALLTDYAASVLERYLAEMRPLLFTAQTTRSERLFGVASGTLSITYNRALKRSCRSLGLPELTSHAFRHALGYHLLRAGCSIRTIQQILGHRNLKDTEVYTKVDAEDLAQVLDSFHPRSRLKVREKR